MKFVRPLVFASVALLPQVALAQEYSGSPGTVTLTTPTYTQNFNTSLASTGSTGTALPPAWRVLESGSNANTSYSVSAGGTADTGDVYSYGATGNSDRALGILRSGSLDAFIGAFFTNGLGATINALTIGYNGEQYRNGAATSNALAFSYSTNATSLSNGTWTSFTALNFNSPNSATISSTPISATISGLSIANGGSFAIRWTEVDASGADDGLAIDDVSITPGLAVTAVPEPATWAMMIGGFGFVGGALRRTRRRPAALA